MINLLPRRNFDSKRQKHYIVIFISLVIFMALIIVAYIKHDTKKKILSATLKNQELSLKITQLTTSYQHKLNMERKKKYKRIRKNLEVNINNAPRSELIRINYAKAQDLTLLIKDKSNTFLSEKGLILADERNNTIWLEDYYQDVQRVKRFINAVDVPKSQVLIEARLVNMSKDYAEDLGIRFGLLNGLKQGESSQNSAGASNSGKINFDLGATPLDATPASLGMALATLGLNVLLDLELTALESEGKAHIIASPKLITSNRESATIESGEDIPYQEYSTNGVTSVAFKKAVLSLKVIPEITFDGKLMMALEINQDSDSGRRVQGVPIITTKSIATNVLVNNGQTIVLGGIYKQGKNNGIVRIPFLGNLPLIGRIFRRTHVKTLSEELLIFITPKIIVNKS